MLIIFLGLVLIGQVISLFLKSIFKNEDAAYVNVEAAENAYVIKKTGYLDLVGDGIKVDLSKQITIRNKEEFIAVFNGYFENLKQNGGYTLQGSGMVTGTATIFGAQVTAYQAAQNIFSVDRDGNNFIESLSVEVPSPSGNTTGYGMSTGKRIWVSEASEKQQGTSNVTYTKENGKYIVSANYDGTEQKEVQKSRNVTLLPFIVDSSSVEEIKIEENALSYNVSIKLNASGYEQIAKDAKEQASAIRTPQFSKFTVEVVMNKFGEVISLSVSQNYIITVKRIGMDIDSNTVSNSSYIIKKEENE